MHPLQKQYNKYIAVENKIGDWLDDPNVPIEEKEPYLPKYTELMGKLNQLLVKMKDSGITFTDEEISHGFEVMVE